MTLNLRRFRVVAEGDPFRVCFASNRGAVGTEFGLLSARVFCFKIKESVSNMFSRLLNSKTKTVTFAAGLLAVSSLFSQLLGFFRNNLLATSFPNDQTDIYFAAFRIPDFVYGILITGGIVAAFLPVFSSYVKKGKEQTEALTNNVLFVFLAALIAISSVLAIFTPFFVKFVVPGFTAQQKVLTVTLMRIMFLSPILLGTSAIFSGILHYFNLFFAYALAPIFYNVGIICGILFFYPLMGLPGLAWGVIFGAFLHLFIQVLPALRYGFRPRFSFNLRFPGLKRIFKLMVPRTLGSAAYHLNLIIITAIASTISVGAISIFNYSNYLYGVPISLIGISFATAVFPALSRNFANREKEKFSKNFSTVFSQIIFLIIPATVLIFLLRAQIVRLIYGTRILGDGFFGWWETRLTAASVGIFAFSLFSACLIPFLARVFFSLQDTRTPVKIAVSIMALNVFLSDGFVWLLRFPQKGIFFGRFIFTQQGIFLDFLARFSVFFREGIGNLLKIGEIGDISVIGLPLALTISSILQFVLLVWFLKKKITGLNFRLIYKAFLKVLAAVIAMVPVVWFGLRICADHLNTHTVLGIFLQLVFSGMLGILSYLLIAVLLGSKEPKVIWSSVLTQFKK